MSVDRYLHNNTLSRENTYSKLPKGVFLNNEIGF